jgi:uncharacterized protein
VATSDSVKLTAFLVKIASRCNLDCDYCYMYHHADQGWRAMPRILSRENQDLFATRLAEYVRAAKISRCAVIFHGGEPLLAGGDEIVSFCERIKLAVGTDARVDFGIQTNGLLLSDAVLDQFESASIDVSLSIDGPKEANDLHRTTRKGRSSFDRVMDALERLKKRPNVFAGVIAVIDTRTPPDTLLEFFSSLSVPKVDFLLPDANHLRLPPGREVSSRVYSDWLTRAFDVWLDKYPHMPVRTFESLLDAIAGLPSKTDAFGFGDVSLITIETDGTYHDLDVLKITREGGTRLDGSLSDTSISELASSPQLSEHRKHLRRDGLCKACQQCPVVEICGGGSVPHRYGKNGFDNPTIYCREMFGLISHAKKRLQGLLTVEEIAPTDLDFQLDEFELAESSAQAMKSLRHYAASEYILRFRAVIEQIQTSGDPLAGVAQELLTSGDLLNVLACKSASIAWARAYESRQQGRRVFAVDGTEITADAGYLNFLKAVEPVGAEEIAINLDDPWLRVPFGKAIDFDTGAVSPNDAKQLVKAALEIIRGWRPALHTEMVQTCDAVQFVRDRTAHPDKIISFSDDAVPGALYVSAIQGAKVVDAYDMADSLIHEHRHQKLYLLERLAPTVQPGAAKVVSPWREELRPPSGLLHAVFVFVELRRFWMFVRDAGPSDLYSRAENQVLVTDRRLQQAFETLRHCPLTASGRALAETLEHAVEREAELGGVA